MVNVNARYIAPVSRGVQCLLCDTEFIPLTLASRTLREGGRLYLFWDDPLTCPGCGDTDAVVFVIPREEESLDA